MSDGSSDEQRAIDVALHDLRARVTWADRSSMTVSSHEAGYTVSFIRQLAAGEPMIRGGGIENGVSYRISRSHAIEEITYPR